MKIQSFVMRNYQVICRLTFSLLFFAILPDLGYSQKIDTIYSSDQFKVIGDTSSRIQHVLIKFEPFIYFSDFRAGSVFKGQKALIDYKSNVTAREFRTRITEGYKQDGLNFAGHYSFVFWGCGSGCQSSAIVDLITGKVYDGPVASSLFEFKKNSRMVIVNPPESSGFYYDAPGYKPEIWIWDERLKKFMQKKER